MFTKNNKETRQTIYGRGFPLWQKAQKKPRCIWKFCLNLFKHLFHPHMRRRSSGLGIFFNYHIGVLYILLRQTNVRLKRTLSTKNTIKHFLEELTIPFCFPHLARSFHSFNTSQRTEKLTIAQRSIFVGCSSLYTYLNCVRTGQVKVSKGL